MTGQTALILAAPESAKRLAPSIISGALTGRLPSPPPTAQLHYQPLKSTTNRSSPLPTARGELVEPSLVRGASFDRLRMSGEASSGREAGSGRAENSRLKESGEAQFCGSLQSYWGPSIVLGAIVVAKAAIPWHPAGPDSRSTRESTHRRLSSGGLPGRWLR